MGSPVGNPGTAACTKVAGVAYRLIKGMCNVNKPTSVPAGAHSMHDVFPKRMSGLRCT